MTTVVVDRAARRISVVGHAGDRDVCISATWSFRTLAECLSSVDALEDVSQDVSVPQFALGWRPSGVPLVESVVSLMQRFASEHPERLKVEFRNAVRHDGERLRQSA